MNLIADAFGIIWSAIHAIISTILTTIIIHRALVLFVLVVGGYEFVARKTDLVNFWETKHKLQKMSQTFDTWRHEKYLGWKKATASPTAFLKAIVDRLATPLAILTVTLGNLLVWSAFQLPFVSRRRKRFEKEALPVLRFKTWRSVVAMGLAGTVIAWMLTNYFVTVLRGLIHFLAGTIQSITNSAIAVSFDWSVVYPSNLLNRDIYVIAPILAYPLLVAAMVIAWRSAWINFEQYRDYNNDEAGDDRFSKINQLKREYKMVPDKQKTYPGHGGSIIIHLNKSDLNGATLRSKMLWRNRKSTGVFTWAQQILGWSPKSTGYYLIDDDTVNDLRTGMTRSGKGETIVNPEIDLISRAEIQSSMVISDPKGELYQSAYATLRKRGYDVEVLSFQNMDWSMSYNPLELAIQAAKNGYYEKVQTLVNAVAESIYRDPKGSDPKNVYWENTSISLFNAITMALIDRANDTFKAGEKDAWDTITIRNVTKFLTDLGSETVQVDANGNTVVDTEGNTRRDTAPGETLISKSAITVYFDQLRAANTKQFSKFREMADTNFRSSDFAAEETKGNVYSSMLSGINLFLQDDVARMTSKNSIDIRSVGNPRRLTVNFPSGMQGVPSPYAHWTAKVSIFSNGTGINPKPILKDQTCLIDGTGYLEAIIKPKLPAKFRIAIRVAPTEDDFNTIKENSYMLTGKKKYVGQRLSGSHSAKRDPYSGKPIFDRIDLQVAEQSTPHEGMPYSLIGPENLEFVYSEKPKALFMVTPPNRPEYNSIVSFFIDQLFNANYDDALNAPGRKTTNRIQFLLDEFANIPGIPKMDQKLSIGLGQNIQFLLIVQNLEQIADKYGDKTSQSIIGNCSINSLLKTTSKNTAEEYSKLLGSKTITKRSKSTNVLNESDPRIDFQNTEQPLMTSTQLLHLEAGEAVVVRGVKAQDKLGRKVSADPIFIHGRSELPYRYMFLDKEFNQKATLSEIPVHSDHRGLDLQSVAVDANETIKHLEDWQDSLNPDEISYIQPRTNLGRDTATTAEEAKVNAVKKSA